MSQWYRVKLELAPNDEFPKGSPGRAYLLRLPLTPAGYVDHALLTLAPKSAMVRRFWPNEPDRSGVIQRNSAGFALVFREGDPEHPEHLQDVQVLDGNTMELAASNGSRDLFRIVSVRPD